MKSLIYPHKPISSIKALSGLLQTPEDTLLFIANNRDAFYVQNKPEKKSDGRERITYRLDNRLKKIQGKINRRIFNAVLYPEYLQGSIKDKNNPRTYDRDASIHLGSRLIITEDVTNFFHSISEKHVNNMWKYFFGFSKEISDLLTSITTYNGYVPQGAVTSSYISNLILWDIEPDLVFRLESMGFVYSRYIDDITVSSTKQWVERTELETSIKLIHGMLNAKGIKINRRKHRIMSGSGRMSVHNLVLNSGELTAGRKRKNNIRLELHILKKLAITYGRRGIVYRKKYNSLSGKIRELSKFHPVLVDKILDELTSISPN